MEIINTIWTALTTENEMLINILALPLTFVEATITVLLFTNILKIAYTKRQQIIYIILFSIIANLSNFFVASPFNSFINILICPILIILLFKVKFFKSILAVLIPNIIFVLTASIIHNVYIILFNVSTEVAVNTPIHKITLSLLVYLFVYIIYRFLKKFKINVTLLDNMKKKNNIILIIDFVVGIITIGVHSYVSFNL